MDLTIDELMVETSPKSGKMDAVNVVPDAGVPETGGSEGVPEDDPLVIGKK